MIKNISSPTCTSSYTYTICSSIDIPVIDTTRSSSGIAAQKGETVALKCNATGNPLPSFEWKKRDLGTVGSKPTITIKILKPADFGKYSCVVSNSVGTITHVVNVFEVGK